MPWSNPRCPKQGNRDVQSSVALAQDVFEQPGLENIPKILDVHDAKAGEFWRFYRAWPPSPRVQFTVPWGLGRRGWGQGHIGPQCVAKQASNRKASKHSDPGSGVGRPARREFSSGTEGPCVSHCTEQLRGPFCAASHRSAVTANKLREPEIDLEDCYVSQCNGLPAEPACATSEVAVGKAVARCKLFGDLLDHRTSQTKGSPESHRAP